mgnify:FL=1
MRGSKKDFTDLFFLLERYSLQNLLETMEKKYSGLDYSQTHILKSLVYFEDANKQPMPRMHKQVRWENIMSRITEAVKTIFFSLD